jgi:mannose-6-phosphate isomerase
MALDWRGDNFPDPTKFPLLLKFIFPSEKLSIQVHPDDAYAVKHESAAGGQGKTEMWHIVSAVPGARVLAGLKPGVTKEMIIAGLSNHGLEDLFQSYEVQAGDTFFIPAGMPHTIGPGMIVCEVQQYSDLTYRIYDYDRRDAAGNLRDLQVEKALEVLDLVSYPGGKVATRARSNRGAKSYQELVDCSYFSVEKFECEDPVHLKVQEPRDRFELWVILEGEGEISWSCLPCDEGENNFGQFTYKPGECWFVPAVFGDRAYYPKTKTAILVAAPGKAPGKTTSATRKVDHAD